jgi:signal transduction histidine kinase
MVLDDNSSRSAEIARRLTERGHRVSHLEIGPESARRLRHEEPDLLVLADEPEGASLAALHAAAHEMGIPLLAVVEFGDDPQGFACRDEAVDDWVSEAGLATELLPRVDRLLRLRKRASPPGANGQTGNREFPAGIQTIPVIVHDLRTPLNVIGLSLRMIEQGIPKNNTDLEEDLRFVEENFKQIERMLAQLSDYFRLFEISAPGPIAEFSPQRLLSELVGSRVERPGARPVSVRLDVDPTCPAEAELDHARARLALSYALANTVAAANGSGTVRVNVRGGPDRWVTEFVLDDPPPPTVTPVELRPDVFERLCGTAAERRGMDLAIVARISELFGGTARLVVEAGRGTRLVLDWPARIQPN